MPLPPWNHPSPNPVVNDETIIRGRHMNDIRGAVDDTRANALAPIDMNDTGERRNDRVVAKYAFNADLAECSNKLKDESDVCKTWAELKAELIKQVSHMDVQSPPMNGAPLVGGVHELQVTYSFGFTITHAYIALRGADPCATRSVQTISWSGSDVTVKYEQAGTCANDGVDAVVVAFG